MSGMITSPQTMPQDFAPRLEARLLNVPQPNLVFARWLRAAQTQSEINAVNPGAFSLIAAQTRAGVPLERGDEANIREALGYGQGGNALGAQGELVFPELVQFVPTGAGRGQHVLINRPKLLVPDTTASVRTITSDNLFFSNATQALQMEQVSVTIKETAGPAKSGALAPIAIDLMTQMTAVHDALANAETQLTYDRNYFLDKFIQVLLSAAISASGQVVRGGDKAANSAFQTQGGDPLTFDLLPKMTEQFANVGVPGIAGQQKYILVLDQHQITDLKNDPAWQRQSVFDARMNPIFPGYVAETESFILCQSNNLTRLSGQGANNDLTVYQGFALAPGILGWALAMLPRLLLDPNNDGGRIARIGWHAFEGFSILDARFAVGLQTT